MKHMMLMLIELLINFFPGDLAQTALMLILISLSNQQGTRRLPRKVKVLVWRDQIDVNFQLSEDFENAATNCLGGVRKGLIQEHSAVKRPVIPIRRQYIRQTCRHNGSGKGFLLAT
ncbi:hypothetical protein D9M68_768030 [compost metagenome]